MILSVAQLKGLVSTTLSDDELESRLLAIESMIRSYTKNPFQNRGVRSLGDVISGKMMMSPERFLVGDTIQVSNSELNSGLYVISEISGFAFTVNPEILYDESGVLITKVQYPKDIVMGAVNLMKWDVENRDKVGIKSETISRWAVTYYDLDSNAILGYPSSLVGFLKPYVKARF